MRSKWSNVETSDRRRRDRGYLLDRDVLAEGKPRTTEFWARTIGHVPLIEFVDGQDDFRWITFLWRGDATTSEVRVGIGDIPMPDPRK